MAKLISFGALIVGGIVVADILIHPTGTKAASSGIQGIEKPLVGGLLGKAP